MVRMGLLAIADIQDSQETDGESLTFYLHPRDGHQEEKQCSATLDYVDDGIKYLGQIEISSMAVSATTQDSQETDGECVNSDCHFFGLPKLTLPNTCKWFRSLWLQECNSKRENQENSSQYLNNQKAN